MSNLALRKVAKLVAFLAMMWGANQAQAYNIQVTGAQREGDWIRYSYTVTDWSTQDTTPGLCDKNPGVKKCTIAFSAYKRGTTDVGYMAQYWDINPRRPSTFGNMLQDMRITIPFSDTVLVRAKHDQSEYCMSLGVGYDPGSGPYTVSQWGVCVPLVSVPIPVQCVVSGDTVLNHGLINENNIEGNRALQILSVSCSGKSSVVVRTRSYQSNSNRIPLRDDGSLYSTIRVNALDATEGVTVGISDGIGSFLVESTLSTNGETVDPGPIATAFVVVVDAP